MNGRYLFQDVEVGLSGRNSDRTVTRHSSYYQRIIQHLVRNFCETGVGLGDGGFHSEYFLSPYPHSENTIEAWVNFCHSSTRFVVQQVFGIRMNSWRCNLEPSELP